MLFWIVSNDEVKNPLNGLLNFSKRHFIRKKKSSVEFGMISKRVQVVIKMCTKLKPLWWYPYNNEWSFRFTPFFLSFKWTYLPIVTRLFSCYFFRTNSSSSPVPFVCFEDFLTPLSIYRMVSLFNLEECQDVENISFFVFPVAMIVKINVFLELFKSLFVKPSHWRLRRPNHEKKLTKLLSRKNALQCMRSKFEGCGFPRAEPFDAFKNGGLTLPVLTTSSLEKCSECETATTLLSS